MGRVGLTTERVVEAGAVLADRLGFRAVTLTRLASEVGVKPASLYAHVRDLDDLRCRIAVRALADVADRAAREMAGRAGPDALVALANAYRDHAREHPGRHDAMRHPLAPDVARASAGPRHAELALAVVRGYPVPDAETTHAVRLIGSTVHGFISLESSGSFDHSDPAGDESWARALLALDGVLRRWPTPTPDDGAPAPAPPREETPDDDRHPARRPAR